MENVSVGVAATHLRERREAEEVAGEEKEEEMLLNLENTSGVIAVTKLRGRRALMELQRRRSIRRMKMAKYNKEAVDKAIKRDPRIKGKEARAIHRLLKGRAKGAMQ